MPYYPQPHWPSDEGLQLINRLACTAGLLIEHMGAYQALHHSRERLQVLTDTVLVLMSYVDRDCRYRFCNRRYADWFGQPVAAHFMSCASVQCLLHSAGQLIGQHGYTDVAKLRKYQLEEAALSLSEARSP
jgi:PAS domain-containing protein